MKQDNGSYKSLFSLIFSVFSLYILGNAFYRWDGFRYYASFSEFLPSVALALILWSFIAFLTSITVWLLFRLVYLLCGLIGWKIRFEHLLFCSIVLALSGILVWEIKKAMWPYVQTTGQIKSIVFCSVIFVSIFVTYFLRNRAGQWTAIMLERITPLVWLFGILIILSTLIVSYHVWIKEFDGRVNVDAGTAVTARDRPNIILVTFDTLAAKEMSAYGYHRETTPFISRWTQNATLFNKAEAGSNFTAPAVASLMTGKRVWTHQTYHIGGTRPVRSNIESLPYLMKKNEYYNIALVVNPFASVKTLGMSGSFDIAPPATEFATSVSLFGWKFGVVDKLLYRAFGEKIRLHNWILKDEFIFGRFINLVSRNIYQTTVPPEKAFKRFFDIIDRNIQEPYFVWIHLLPPHDPYLPPEDYMKIFNSSSELRAYKPQEKLIKESYKYLFQSRSYPEEMQPAVNLMRDYYDEFIKYIDNAFEDFIVELDKRQLENTVVILSADHGESFEHGYFTHGGPFLYEQVTHIPLIIKEPGQQSGQVINDIVGQIDIPATILDFAGISVPSWMEGRSLLPLIRGETLSKQAVFSMNFEENPSRGNQIQRGSVAVWEGDYKLIHYLKKDESLLFNLKQDPDELNDLINTEPGIAQRLLTHIMTNLKKANEKINKEK